MSAHIRRKLLSNGFHLCGSRAVGNSSYLSDWDYVARDTCAARELLEFFLFKDISHKPRGLDVNTVAIFEMDDVQVALVKNLEVKLLITEAMRKNKTLRDIDRSLRKSAARQVFWNALYSIAGLT